MDHHQSPPANRPDRRTDTRHGDSGYNTHLIALQGRRQSVIDRRNCISNCQTREREIAKKDDLYKINSIDHLAMQNNEIIWWIVDFNYTIIAAEEAKSEHPYNIESLSQLTIVILI